MTKPMASQTMSRHQFSGGSENISIRQVRMPMIGMNGTHGQRNGRSAFGYFLRMINTAVQTMTKASSVPMLVRCSSASMGSSPAATQTQIPIRMVDFHGVRNFGWTSAKNRRENRAARGHG